MTGKTMVLYILIFMHLERNGCQIIAVRVNFRNNEPKRTVKPITNGVQFCGGNWNWNWSVLIRNQNSFRVHFIRNYYSRAPMSSRFICQ
jgi:hypothetical protein